MERKKRELADRIMARFFTYFSPWLEKNFGVECYDDDDDDGGGGASSGVGGGGACRTGSTSGAGGSRNASGSKKRQQRDDSDDGGDDGCASEDDDGNRRRRNNKRVRRDSGTRRHALRFACPFYKYDKKRYAKHRTCCGPGWIDIHRVKYAPSLSVELPRFLLLQFTPGPTNAFLRTPTPESISFGNI
jgi:hypothetical protein